MINSEVFNLFCKVYNGYKVHCKLYDSFIDYVVKFQCYYDNIEKKCFIDNDYNDLISKFNNLALKDLLNLSLDEFRYLEKLYISRRNKRKVINRRINNYLCNYDKLYFVTLTLNDRSLKKKCIDRLVKKYLKNNFVSFIFNKDYGCNGRLHYHGLIPDININLLHLHKKNNFNLINYNYGFSSVKEINLNDNIKINSYILKVSNHALKFSTGLDNLIYSIDKV